MWEPDADLGTKWSTAGYHDPEQLEVRPYQPRPWVEGPEVAGVVYKNDNVDLRPQSQRPIGPLTQKQIEFVLKEGTWQV